MFTSQAASTSPRELGRHVQRYSLAILGLVLPFTLVLIVFAHPLLARWISPYFADHATAPLQVMAVAALASGLAQVPFTMLQGRARADITGKLHLVELPGYVGLLYVLVLHYGPLGAAWAWLLRILIDMAALYYLCFREFRSRAPQTSLIAE